MKKILIPLLLLFCALWSSAQVHWSPVVKSYNEYLGLKTDSVLEPPHDTLGTAPIYTLAIKNNHVYQKLSTGIWSQVDGGGNAVQSLTGSQSIQYGPFSAMPTPGTPGRYYAATDSAFWLIDNGIAWINLSGSSSGGGSGTVLTANSVQGDGSSGNKIQLVNDAATPGNIKYYGTDAAGVKGFIQLGTAAFVDKPASGNASTVQAVMGNDTRLADTRPINTDQSVQGDGTAGNKVKLVNDNATPGNSKYYGTDGGGAKGYFALPAGSTAANPSATISGTAVNGTATTFMRSDAAPALATNGVGNTNLAQMNANTIKVNNTGSTANAIDGTVTQVTAMLNPFTTSLKGLVPTPGGSATGRVLQDDGAWHAPAATFDSATSQGGTFHTGNFNDSRYLQSLIGIPATPNGAVLGVSGGHTALIGSAGIPETELGLLFSQKIFANLNWFTNNGATVSATSSHLAFSSTTNNDTKSLDIDSLIGRNGYTSLPKYKMEIEVIPGTKTSTSFVGLGTRSNITAFLANLLVRLNTSTDGNNGKISIGGIGASGGGGDTTYATSSAAIAYTALTDTLLLSIERVNERYIGAVRNKTTHSTAVNLTFPFSIRAGMMEQLPNLGKFAIFGAGSFIVDSIGIRSNTTKNPAVMYISDSKGILYAENWDNTTFSRLVPHFGSVVWEGGSSETATDRRQAVPEMTTISPKAMVIEVGRNGGIVDTADLRGLYNDLVAAGQTVYFLTPPYDVVSDAIAVVAWERANFPAGNIIDGYFAIKDCGAPCIAIDNVHLTPLGHGVIANQIINSYKLARGVTILDDTPYVKAPGSLMPDGKITFTGVNNTVYTSTNLVWDNLNNRLGIKNGGPIFDVDLTGTMRATGFLVNANNTGNNASLKLTSFGGIHGYGLDFGTNAGVFFMDSLTNNMEMGLLTTGQINMRDRNGNPLIHLTTGSSSSSMTISGGNVYGGFNNNPSNPLTLNAGVSSGNATPQPIIFQTTLVGSSGSTDQTLAERFRIVRKSFSNSTTPHDAAAIDLSGTTTQGFLPPLVTTTQMNAIASPTKGLLVINTDSSLAKCLMVYDGGWVVVSGSGGGGGGSFGPVTSSGGSLAVTNGTTTPNLEIDFTKANTWNTAGTTTFQNSASGDVARFQQTGSTFAGVYITPSSGQDAYLIYENGINQHQFYVGNSHTSNKYVVLASDANSNITLQSISQTGAHQWPQYGSGTFTGTAVKGLAADASGNIIEVPLPYGSGSIHVVGDADYTIAAGVEFINYSTTLTATRTITLPSASSNSGRHIHFWFQSAGGNQFTMTSTSNIILTGTTSSTTQTTNQTNVNVDMISDGTTWITTGYSHN